MQRKKDEVRRRIHDAALEEFLEKSYKKTTIRSISRKSGVPIGNIYRYFENKDAIFENVVSKFYIEITKIFKEEPVSYKLDKEEILKKFDEGTFLLGVAERVTGLSDDKEKSNVGYILLNNSEGSRYENFKEQLEGLFVRNFLEAFKKIIDDDKVMKENEKLLTGLGVAYLKSISCILQTYSEDKEIARKLVIEFSVVYSKNLPGRLGLK